MDDHQANSTRNISKKLSQCLNLPFKKLENVMYVYTSLFTKSSLFLLSTLIKNSCYWTSVTIMFAKITRRLCNRNKQKECFGAKHNFRHKMFSFCLFFSKQRTGCKGTHCLFFGHKNETSLSNVKRLLKL